MQEEASPSPLTKRTEVIVSLRRLRIGRAIKVEEVRGYGGSTIVQEIVILQEVGG